MKRQLLVLAGFLLLAGLTYLGYQEYPRWHMSRMWQQTTCSGEALPNTDYTGGDVFHWQAICLETKHGGLDILKMVEWCVSPGVPDKDGHCATEGVIVYFTFNEDVKDDYQQDIVNDMFDGTYRFASKNGKYTTQIVVQMIPIAYQKTMDDGSTQIISTFYWDSRLECPVILYADMLKAAQSANRMCRLYKSDEMQPFVPEWLWIGRLK